MGRPPNLVHSPPVAMLPSKTQFVPKAGNFPLTAILAPLNPGKDYYSDHMDYPVVLILPRLCEASRSLSYTLASMFCALERWVIAARTDFTGRLLPSPPQMRWPSTSMLLVSALRTPTLGRAAILYCAYYPSSSQHDYCKSRHPPAGFYAPGQFYAACGAF